MAESGEVFNPELKINLTAIKKCDKFVVNIIDNASQVALYKFKSDTQAWEKTEVEGALFVYSRSTHPRNSFFIMNRLKMENLREPITADMEFKLQEPFLLYRNKARDIFGIWFYDGAECLRLGQLMISLSTAVEDLKPSITKQKSSQERQQTGSNGKVDLLKLFAAAEEKYKKGSGKMLEEPVPAEEMKPSLGKQQQLQQGDTQPQEVSSRDPSLKLRAQSLPVYRMSPTRQQIISGTEKSEPAQRQALSTTSVQEPVTATQNVSLASIRIPVVTEKPSQEEPVKPLAQRKLFQASSSAASLPSQESLQKQPDSGTGTSLMSPLAFQSSARPSTNAGSTPAVNKPSITPLEMEQFVQAFTYLVKNDGDFVQRLHEAYVKTLQGN